jgi:hypothetical protein
VSTSRAAMMAVVYSVVRLVSTSWSVSVSDLLSVYGVLGNVPKPHAGLIATR